MLLEKIHYVPSETIEKTLDVLKIAKCLFDEFVDIHLDKHSSTLILEYLLAVIEAVDEYGDHIDIILFRVKLSKGCINLSKKMYLDDEFILSHIMTAQKHWETVRTKPQLL